LKERDKQLSGEQVERKDILDRPDCDIRDGNSDSDGTDPNCYQVRHREATPKLSAISDTRQAANCDGPRQTLVLVGSYTARRFVSSHGASSAWPYILSFCLKKYILKKTSYSSFVIWIISAGHNFSFIYHRFFSCRAHT
jgi:hypothetical protein